MNSEPDFTDFANCSVAIWGLGLMGGSLAYALSGRCASLIGIDPDAITVELATKSGIFDHVSPEPENLINKADVIILAAPVCAILEQIQALPRLHNQGCIVFDLGSTKMQIVNALRELPPRFDPLGGHPMCGNEHSSFQHANANLFCEAAFALVELNQTSARAKTIAEQCVKIIGANPLWLDEKTHDQWTAMTSHSPYIVANALAASISPDGKPMAGSGLKSTSRLAAAAPEMMLDILKTNQEFLLESLNLFKNKLEEIETDIRNGEFKSLLVKLEEGRTARNRLFQ